MMRYDYTPLYYSSPIQVKYYDEQRNDYAGAIALHDYLIDGKSGNVLKLDDVVKTAGNRGIHFDDAIIEKSWKDLDEIIKN